MSRGSRKAGKKKQELSRSAIRRQKYSKFSKAPENPGQAAVAAELELAAKRNAEQVRLQREAAERAAARSFGGPLRRLAAREENRRGGFFEFFMTGGQGF